MAKLSPGFKITRYQNQKLKYDTDLGQQLILRMRISKTESGDTITPITPLLQLRFISDDDVIAPRANPLQLRSVEVCIPNPQNITQESRLTVPIPYKPTDMRHTLHIRELVQYPNVVSIEYTGEGSK